MMKKTLSTMLLLAVIPLAVRAQWSANLSYGWLGNISPDWTEDFGDRPFSLWGGGWQAGVSLEHRSRDWLAWGLAGAYQIFGREPSGSAVNDGQVVAWSGQESWQAPVSGYIRLIKPRAIMGTNLRLGLGAMASHLGRLEVSRGGSLAEALAGTGETIIRPFGQVGLGIKAPVSRRLGVSLDYGVMMTFDRAVAEMPITLGLEMGW